MQVAIRSPDFNNRQQLVQALAADQMIDVVFSPLGGHDIELVDASLFLGNGHAPPRLTSSATAIVVFAPCDPEQLAYYLASGARGYHCRGEPWDRLIDTVHQVSDGEVRAEPRVLHHLLQYYRRLRRETGYRDLPESF